MSLFASAYIALLIAILIVTFCATVFFFFFNDSPTTDIYTLSLHDALPIFALAMGVLGGMPPAIRAASRPVAHEWPGARSEEHTSELQSLRHLVCRLLLEKKKTAHQPTETSAR